MNELMSEFTLLAVWLAAIFAVGRGNQKGDVEAIKFKLLKTVTQVCH